MPRLPAETKITVIKKVESPEGMSGPRPNRGNGHRTESSCKLQVLTFKN